MSEVTQSCPTLAASWTVAHQAPLSMGFSRQEYWSGLPFPSPGDLPNPGIKPTSPALQVDSLLLSHQEAHIYAYANIYLMGMHAQICFISLPAFGIVIFGVILIEIW